MSSEREDLLLYTQTHTNAVFYTLCIYDEIKLIIRETHDAYNIYNYDWLMG